MGQDLIPAVRGAMTRLTPPQQKILDLAYGEGLTQREIAERIARPLETIKSWFRVALRALRKEMVPCGAGRSEGRL